MPRSLWTDGQNCDSCAPVAPDVPKKLKHDAIVEALLEIQFNHTDVPEVVIGKLASAPIWSGYAHERLPFADFPAAVREMDPALRFQPTIQATPPLRTEVIRFGPHSLSIHALAPYAGWEVYSKRLAAGIAALFDACPSANVRRLGLRYINALTPIHGVSSLWDMDVSFLVNGEKPSDELTAAYIRTDDHGFTSKVSIATPKFVQGSVPVDAIAIIDVDISSEFAVGHTSTDSVIEWVEVAHGLEKKEFFSLWPTTVLSVLVED